MDTLPATTLFRKASYCRCGIVFLDETGRVAALNAVFFDATDLNIKEGAALPDELLGLQPGDWTFLGKEWFVQAGGQQRIEVLVIRRVRAADQILAPYGDSPNK